MICYECGHVINKDFAKFCDYCGSSLENKPKHPSPKKDIKTNINDQIDQATNLFLLWNASIAATFVFYIIHIVTDGYIYLFLLVLMMLTMSWILLLTKLHDLSIRHHQSTKQFILTNFGVPLIGTFYSFIKLTQK